METDEQMLQVYRHDAHKMRGRSHAAGSRTLAGVTVNENVPYGADGDAAALSRPNGKPEPTVDGHDTHYRLSLLTGRTRYDPETFSLKAIEDDLTALLGVSDAEAMHRSWLRSDAVSGFNEATSYPYTSLKYHTLLVGALADLYRNGHTFDELHLCVDAADAIVPYRTVFSNQDFSLRIDAAPDGACARLGSRPWQSWSSVWSRLTEHPLDTANSKFDMTLDAELRRIQSWSTALQFIGDYTDWRPDI
jgi:hypothetical protein